MIIPLTPLSEYLMNSRLLKEDGGVTVTLEVLVGNDEFTRLLTGEGLTHPIPCQAEKLNTSVVALLFGRCIDYRKAEKLMVFNLFELSRVPGQFTVAAFGKCKVQLNRRCKDIVSHQGKVKGEFTLVMDLDYSPYAPMTNCCVLDVKELFKGYKMANVEVEPPKGITVAVSQLLQCILNTAASQYGGISVNRTDELFAPYVELSYQKHLNKVLDEWRIITGGEEATRDELARLEGIAYARTKEETYNAFQGLEYGIGASMASTGQTPFITLGFGLGTDRFARLVTESILRVRKAGVGPEHKTAVFPKLVYGLKDGVNLKPDDPNYDLKQLAMATARERIYPDVLSWKMAMELTGGYRAPMGW